MRTLLRMSILAVCLLLSTAGLTYLFWYQPKFRGGKQPFSFAKASSPPKEDLVQIKLHAKALALKEYVIKNGFNADCCFMINMSVPSGRQRFFVYNFKTGKVDKAGLVTHGSGSETGGDKLYFSNVPGSSCSSLGKYKIANAYQGRFGLAYKLHGLDKTNSKAYERFVVLHGHSCVPAGEVHPLPICPSLGCPTVAPAFLKLLSNIIDGSGKPVLLSIYQ